MMDANSGNNIGGDSHEHVYRCQDCGEIGRGPVESTKPDEPLIDQWRPAMDFRKKAEAILELQKGGVPGIKKSAPAQQHHYWRYENVDPETEETETIYINFEDKLNQLTQAHQLELDKARKEWENEKDLLQR